MDQNSLCLDQIVHYLLEYIDRYPLDIQYNKNLYYNILLNILLNNQILQQE